MSVIVILVLLVIADRVGNAIAEDQFATQAQQSGLGVKPSVDIHGFPFLTQLASDDFKTVTMTAQNVPAGPLSISSINVTATGLHPQSMSAAKVDHISGTGLVTFSALANAGSSGGGSSSPLGGSDLVTMKEAGPDEVQISAGPVTENAKIVRSGNTISIQVVNNGDLLSGILSSFGNFSFTIPKLPGGLQVTNLQVTTQGLSISLAATNTELSQ